VLVGGGGGGVGGGGPGVGGGGGGGGGGGWFERGGRGEIWVGNGGARRKSASSAYRSAACK